MSPALSLTSATDPSFIRRRASISRRRFIAANKLLTSIFLLVSIFLDMTQATAEGMNMHYPEERLTTILESVASFESVEQEDACQRLVEELSPDDQEVAARTSYAYWYTSTFREDKDCLSPTIQRNMALREARRHLVGVGGNKFDKALESLQRSVAHRKDYNIDVLRLCFVPEAAFASDDDKRLCERYQSLLKEEIPKQLIVVRGKDNMNRPILVYLSRQESSPEFDTEAFILARLYALERAIAAVEYLSMGKEETMVGIFRTGGYQQAHMPPLAAIKQAVTVLQGNYPERLEKFVMLDPPFWMRSIHAILSIFLDEDTASKIAMVSGEPERLSKLGEIMSKDQAMPFMLPEGELTSPIDPMHFLHEVPFHCLYDECNPKVADDGTTTTADS